MHYFADVDEVWDALPAERREVVEAVREVLGRVAAPYAPPEATSTTYDADGATVDLKIRHAEDGTGLAVLASDRRVVLHWPGGMLAAPAWSTELAETLEAMLTGGNVLRGWLKGGKVVRAQAEVWLPGRVRRRLALVEAPGGRAKAMRWLPGQGRRMDATLSFLRTPALAPTAPEDVT
ncbi:hypothetical protein OJ997_31050 [Solirubrobacter phytolaccae]|uniref:Uncharacterized protein n=1 Tax=Solirubrobacter phytolaccae TaxID=1404360 RepID=A0A9X3NJR0_9ACTN|nr:hypothetical protein [Solirubrobacter phytolaccae]MDA0184781.1 hypothetical protein [Solirubrobacter phytolaccae]